MARTGLSAARTPSTDDGAWPSLRVDSWKPTRDTVHMWTQIVGKIKMTVSPPVNHWWHAALYLSPRGITTGPIPGGRGVFEIELDFSSHRLTVQTSSGEERGFPLSGHSVADFYADIFAVLRELDVEVTIHPTPNEVLVATPFFEDTAHCTYVPDHAHAFWSQLIEAQRVLQLHRSRFRGKASPVHYFWGAIDLAVTRFSGRPAPRHPGGAPNCPDSVMVEGYSRELSSAGFWPGGGEEGAFYSYAYPEPGEFENAPMPEGAYYDADLGEFLLPYETVRRSPDPDALVLEFLERTYQAAATLGDWPVEQDIA
ncbi:DUF5996 family protein [Humibacter soli]